MNAAPDRALAPGALDRLALDLQELRQDVVAGEAHFADELASVHPDNRRSARNLVHYLALRRHDLRGLQLRLARAGLSSLGRAEPHVLVTIDRVVAMLALARGETPSDATPPPAVGFRQGERILAANARRLLGPRRRHRSVRIVVTLSAEAAEDPRFVHALVGAGMDCARINCARDDAAAWSAMAGHVRAAERAHERSCRIFVDLAGSKPRTGAVAGGAKRLKLAVGDQFELVADDGVPVRDGARPRIAVSTPEILSEVQPGQAIWFDDGKIGGTIVERTADGLLIRVTDAKPEGSKLRPDRGINLPESSMSRATFTEKDRDDLDQVVAWADAIELSFVQRPEEVRALHEELRRHDADHVGVVLKIETRHAFEGLAQLLFAAMQRRTCGVMIARGDLAVEVGFERMAEVQEEILWLAEAAHAPTIWATQVLDDLAKKGTLSRAEVSDAAMSARAEAVMLNKGPFVIDAIDTLDDILARMKEHQSKKRSLLRALRVSGRAWQ